MPIDALLAIIVATVAVLLDLKIIMICLEKINSQRYFNRFNRNTWVIIVIFGSVIGQCLYLISENY